MVLELLASWQSISLFQRKLLSFFPSDRACDLNFNKFNVGKFYFANPLFRNNFLAFSGVEKILRPPRINCVIALPLRYTILIDMGNVLIYYITNLNPILFLPVFVSCWHPQIHVLTSSHTKINKFSTTWKSVSLRFSQSISLCPSNRMWYLNFYKCCGDRLNSWITWICSRVEECVWFKCLEFT